MDVYSEAFVMSGRVGRTVAAAAAAVLLLCLQSLHGSALPAVSSYEFTAYRMQQFNLVQQKHGEFRGLAAKAAAWWREHMLHMQILLHSVCIIETWQQFFFSDCY